MLINIANLRDTAPMEMVLGSIPAKNFEVSSEENILRSQNRMFHCLLQPHNPGPEHESVTGRAQPVETPQHLTPPPVQVQQQQQELKPVQIEAPATSPHQIEPQPQLVETQSAQPQVCVFITSENTRVKMLTNHVNNDH